MRRLPILVKLTAAFAGATLLMLAAAAVFVYLRLGADLDDRVNASLRARSAAAANALDADTSIEAVAVEDPEESFAQVLSSEGVRETAGSLIGPALTPEEIRQLGETDVVIERQLPGIDGNARILAVAHPSPSGPVVIAIGQSLLDRDEALASVVKSFVVGGVVALVVASGAGYGLAKAGLAPVEAMRSRASRISAQDDDEGLPLPEAQDQIRRLGETLNDMLRRLRASYVRERRFVDDASHELRTPLAVIQTDIEGALLAANLTPAVREALTSALDETHRLVRIADDLLVLARAGDGHLPIHAQRLSVSDLMTWTRTRFAGIAEQAERSIVTAVPRDLVVIADRDRLRQVMTNLVDNALRHGSGEITLAASRTSGGITFEIRDEGDGFPAAFAPRAFDRLSRADPGRRGRGAGIGLAIVDAIIRAHGGTSTVDVGHPARVRLWLPS